jgi:hypothetical protein
MLTLTVKISTNRVRQTPETPESQKQLNNTWTTEKVELWSRYPPTLSKVLKKPSRPRKLKWIKRSTQATPSRKTGSNPHQGKSSPLFLRVSRRALKTITKTTTPLQSKKRSSLTRRHLKSHQSTMPRRIASPLAYSTKMILKIKTC